MRIRIPFTRRISFRILLMLVLLFTITATVISVVNRNNIRRLYEENFTERVLLTNSLMSSVIDGDDVDYFVGLIMDQDDAFRERQVRFYHDRLDLWALQEAGEDEEMQRELFERLVAFHGEMAVYKNDHYWRTVAELRRLKEISHSTFLYVMSDTGLVSDDGERLFTFIIDAEDSPVYDDPGIDGLGTCDTSQGTMEEVYTTKKQMDWVSYYNGEYGELYYSYSPIFNKNGDVIAILGTDIDLGNMNVAVSSSVLLLNSIFLALFISIVVFIFFFLRRSITYPLVALTETAHELAQGNIYSSAPASALKRRDEIGVLSNAVNEMSSIYQDLINKAAELFKAANVGKLDVRSDAGRFKGDIQDVIVQINNTLDSMTLYLNGIPESIFIMSKDLETYFRNDQFIAYFGDIPAADFISEVLATAGFPPADGDAELLAEQVGEILRRENNNTTVWMNGLCLSIILKEIVLSGDAGANSILAIAVDITDLMREKENAQAATKAKSDFLSRMSHEMRTPMNAIIGMTKISEATDDVSRLRYCLSSINSSSEHLLGIINDVLDMSKIEAGKFDLEKVSMNLEKMLMKVCNIVIDNMEKKNQKLNVVLSKDLHLNYVADDLRLSQVITNLLSNAVKFTPEGGSITLAAEKAAQNNNFSTLRFTITDTGIGMTADQVARLFNAFEQADGSVSRKFGGTGLGLAISKNIVEKMNGRIWVESEPGAGSTFIFEVDLECSSRQETVIFDGISPEDIRLLIVENDGEMMRRFIGIIESFGMKADSAASEEDTFALIDRAAASGHVYDIVILDYNMPGIDGSDFINRVSERIDKNTVVIITTHLEWHRIEKFAYEKNITRYITKPIFPSSVLDAINDVVGHTLKSLEIKTDHAEEVPDLSSVTVILAEDVEINREIFLALLEDTRISVDAAENGFVAVEKFKRDPERYDLIIMDIQMPEMDGYQATRTIRALDIPKAKTIPIIAMTANVFKEDIDRCIESGMNDHLPKPIDAKVVIDKIVKYLKKER